jgi:hypothetical protein
VARPSHLSPNAPGADQTLLTGITTGDEAQSSANRAFFQRPTGLPLFGTPSISFGQLSLHQFHEVIHGIRLGQKFAGIGHFGRA